METENKIEIKTNKKAEVYLSVAKKLHECAGIINEAYDEIFNLYNGNTDLIDDHYDRTISEVNDFADFIAGRLGMAIVDSSK